MEFKNKIGNHKKGVKSKTENRLITLDSSTVHLSPECCLLSSCYLSKDIRKGQQSMVLNVKCRKWLTEVEYDIDT